MRIVAATNATGAQVAFMPSALELSGGVLVVQRNVGGLTITSKSLQAAYPQTPSSLPERRCGTHYRCAGASRTMCRLQPRGHHRPLPRFFDICLRYLCKRASAL